MMYEKMFILLTTFRIVLLVLVPDFGEIFTLSARYSHHSVMNAPACHAHTSTVSLSLLDTNRVPNHYRLESSRITKPSNGTVPFDSFKSEVT